MKTKCQLWTDRKKKSADACDITLACASVKRGAVSQSEKASSHFPSVVRKIVVFGKKSHFSSNFFSERWKTSYGGHFDVARFYVCLYCWCWYMAFRRPLQFCARYLLSSKTQSSIKIVEVKCGLFEAITKFRLWLTKISVSRHSAQFSLQSENLYRERGDKFLPSINNHICPFNRLIPRVLVLCTFLCQSEPERN